ncbi:hypothetical protein O3M35_003915 [Rhynocoris fuscipes]|uniref:Amino acid transporter transmembrane domain-containing protein n=1 Tax=Rhynocoris fuscipes TaxID=488301 RepID=A0AAW1CP29_9HEMI
MSQEEFEEIKLTKSASEIRASHAIIRKTTYLESIIHLIKGNVGAGLFAMGKAIQHAGLFFGFVSALVIGSICTYNNHVLVNCANHIQMISKSEFLPNFPETVELCFRIGPEKLRRLHVYAGMMTKSFIIVTQLGFCSIYLVFVAETTLSILKRYVDNIPQDTRIYICIVAVPMIATALISTLKFLTPVSFISDALIFTGILLCVYACSMSGFPHYTERALIQSPEMWPVFIATTVFSFEGIALVIPIHNEMINTELFGKPYGVLNIGMLIVVLGTASMGLIGYWRFGDDIKGSITLNFDHEVVGQILQLCVGIGILLTYAIQFHVAVDVTWWDVVKIANINKNVLLWELAYRLGLALMTVLAAATIPFLHIFVTIVGSIFSTTLALFLPAMCDVCIRTAPADIRLKSSNKFIQVFRFFMDFITLVLASIALVTGSIISFYELYKAFKEQ